MAVAGIDVGSETVKAVVLKESAVHHSILRASGYAGSLAEQALGEALSRCGLRREELEHVIATGIGEGEFEFASGIVSEATAVTRGMHWLTPSVRTVVSMGAEGCMVVKTDEEGSLVDYTTNQACGAGTGMLLEVVAEALEVELKDIGEQSLRSTKDVTITSSCAVFAESEVVSLVATGTNKADIFKGIHESLASRIVALMSSVHWEPDVALVGGVGRNVGLVRALERQLGVVIVVPDVPEVVQALGAAIVAKDWK